MECVVFLKFSVKTQRHIKGRQFLSRPREVWRFTDGKDLGSRSQGQANFLCRHAGPWICEHFPEAAFCCYSASWVSEVIWGSSSGGAAAVVAQLLNSDMPISVPDQLRINEINLF